MPRGDGGWRSLRAYWSARSSSNASCSAHRSAGALTRLGLGRPRRRAVAAAAVLSALVLTVYPVSFALSGDPVRLRSDWVWLLIGLFAFHGLAEELLWRGFAFRLLRQGRSFRSALSWTMPLIAATHIPIVFNVGIAVGVGAMVVAAVTSVPFGFLYEAGGNTIWGPALVHTAIDSFKLVIIPAAALTALPALLIVAAIAVPLLVLLVPRGYFDGGEDQLNSVT